MKIHILLLAFTSLLFGSALSSTVVSKKTGPPSTLHPPPSTPKNIILMIGDGMGLSQVSAGMYASLSHRLHIERCPVTGLIKTQSARDLITDSAAGATAFSCGCKTYNAAIGMDARHRPCRTFLELADSLGLATGLVATCSVTHATPAAFIAHVDGRSETEAIAAFFVESGLDILIGGGLKAFTERKSDARNLRQEMVAKGWQISDYTGPALRDLKPDPAAPFAWFSAFDEPVSVAKGRDYLPTAARLAPDFLKKRSNGKGFFMMLEGSQIDWAGHANQADDAVLEMLDFDAAIGQVLDFAAADGQTLVIITADHETGGMALAQGSAADSLDIEFMTNYHTPVMVPVFAYGPGAEAFSGVYENTEIFWKMKKALTGL